MSTKTLRKRIALATVAALGAGVLSLVSTTAANAAANPGGTLPTGVAAGGNNVAPAANVLAIATYGDTNGTVTAYSGATTGDSLGLLTASDILGSATPTLGTTQTATLLASGTLLVYTSASNDSLITVTGGTIVGSSSSNIEAINSTLTAAAAAGTGAVSPKYLQVAVKPNSGVTSMTVSLQTGTKADGASALVNGTGTATLTLNGFITVTVASTNASGLYSAAKSGVWYTDSTHATQTGDYSGLTTPGSATVGNEQYADIRIRDAYGSAVTGAAILQASATNGALVKIASSAPATSGSLSTHFVSSSNATLDDYIVRVDAPSSAPLSTVVTVTWNGTVVGTKSFTFSGQIAKVTLSSASNGKTNDATSGHNTAVIAFADAAGNTVYPTAAYVAQDNTGFAGIVTSVSMTTTPASGVVGKVSYGCGVTSGSAAIAVQYTNTDGTVIKSNSLPVTCSGDANTYTVKYDKSTYKPGEVATLTITFKDSKGNLANDYTSVAASTAAAISTSGLTAISGPTTKANGLLTTNGVVTYTYAVGTTTGTFVNTIVFSEADTAAKANSLTASGPATATLTIADGSTSLNDVLKGIVSLIASINKQIAALAKLVTKKK